MKTLFTTLFLVFIFSVMQAQAQLKPSREPRPQAGVVSGETILMPVIINPISPEAAHKTAGKTKFARTAPRKRTGKMEKTYGVYKMEPNQNWGTQARLNHFARGN